MGTSIDPSRARPPLFGLALLLAAAVGGCGEDAPLDPGAGAQRSLAGTATATSDAAPVTAAAAPAGDTQMIRHVVPVTAGNPSATQEVNKHRDVPNDHIVYAPATAGARRGKLFLFIGGTNHAPQMTEMIMEAGVRRGYHGLNIAYSNYQAVAAACLQVRLNETEAEKADCHGAFRDEVITGENTSTRVDVTKPNAILTRVRTLLRYLRETYPAEGWDQFLSGGDVDWSKVSVAGHSQGAGNSAILAKTFALQRAVLMSGTFDVETVSRKQAAYHNRPNVTPPARQYGFSHTKDTTVPIVAAEASWDAIGMGQFGPLRSVDGAGAPYGGSHKLSTSEDPRQGTGHVSVIGDAQMPRQANGRSIYEPVWDHMLFP